jgi:hypothetical protein
MLSTTQKIQDSLLAVYPASAGIAKGRWSRKDHNKSVSATLANAVGTGDVASRSLPCLTLATSTRMFPSSAGLGFNFLNIFSVVGKAYTECVLLDEINNVRQAISIARLARGI